MGLMTKIKSAPDRLQGVTTQGGTAAVTAAVAAPAAPVAISTTLAEPPPASTSRRTLAATPPPALAQPCPICGCPLYWTSAYDSADLAEPRCRICSPPPSPSLVGEWWFVVLDVAAMTPEQLRDPPSGEWQPPAPSDRRYAWESYERPAWLIDLIRSRGKARRGTSGTTNNRLPNPGRVGAGVGGSGAVRVAADAMTDPIPF